MSKSALPISYRLLWGCFFILISSAAYLYGFPQPNMAYVGVVLLHTAIGLIAALLLAVKLLPLLRSSSYSARAGWLLTSAAAGLGLALIEVGTSRAEWKWLYAHIVLGLLGAGLLIGDRIAKAGWIRSRVTAVLVSLCIVVALSYGVQYLRHSWHASHRIANPQMPPPSMTGEGDGPSGPFFPSSAQVYGQQKIPSKFFMESDSCKRCHEGIYNQWFSSAHHFSSFNNQWYRKSIEYMHDTIGTQPSKWCGGCHDPAVLYAGLMDTPIKKIVHRPEAQAGLGCMMCHSIADVKSTMGQGDFYLEYPKLHELAATRNPL